MPVKKYTHQELCNEIYKAVMEATEPLTRLEICHAIGRKKSPHILAMIEELAAGGWLIRQRVGEQGQLPIYGYSIGRVHE